MVPEQIKPSPGQLVQRFVQQILILLIYLLGLLLTLIIATSLVMNILPVFGAYPKGERLQRIQNSPNTDGTTFSYLEPTKVMAAFDITKFPAFFRRGNTIPDKPLPSLPLDHNAYGSLAEDELHFTWFGHSILLIEMGNTRVLIDPVFSPTPSPFSFAGNPAFTMEVEHKLEDLPAIDVVLISHDHYDHLDYQSILWLKDRVKHFVCSLGVGAHLERWGISADKITELDWWETSEVAKLSITSTPARHFSGRRLKRNQALWGGFAIKYGDKHNVLYAGDSGFGPHFGLIGEKLGPFDLAFLECGQYNDMWYQIHALPEELPEAWKAVKADVMMPIHWGRFKLAMHDWTDPVDRLLAAVPPTDHGRLITPLIGERVDPKSPEAYLERWWL